MPPCVTRFGTACCAATRRLCAIWRSDDEATADEGVLWGRRTGDGAVSELQPTTASTSHMPMSFHCGVSMLADFSSPPSAGTAFSEATALAAGTIHNKATANHINFLICTAFAFFDTAKLRN